MTDLILGTVENYDFYQIEPFLVTLRQSGFAGHLCLFAGPGISRRTIDRIRRGGAEVIAYGPDFPFVGDPHPDSPKSLPNPIYIFNYRHFLYYDYLLKRGDAFANVLITDVKDVVFQDDPFARPVEDRIHVAMESRAIPIGDCYWTSSWILAGYESEALERVKDKEISCAGTTLAPVPLMKRYLQLMLAEIEAMKDAFACADQAAHNLLLHAGKLEPTRRLYNFEGPVLTVGTEADYQLDAQRRLVNRDGSVIAIVHQYDRHRDLIQLVDRKVRPRLASRLAAGFVYRWKRRLIRRFARLRRMLARTAGRAEA